MKIRYIYSACVEIETKNLRILCDPWFTDGIYDGSWFHFPKIKDALKIIKKPDIIYISHIHPDHYDPIFLKSLFKKYGDVKVIIPNLKKNYLLFKSKSDGIKTDPVDHLKIGQTNLHIVPNMEGSESDIDSSLYVNDGVNSFLNLNDCMWNNKQNKSLKKIINNYPGKIDLLALGYTGAGPYPQTYYDTKYQKKILKKKAKLKEDEFIKRYLRYKNFFKAKLHLPFAGKYILGGKLHKLNQYRGIIDPIEIKNYDNTAVILADAGKGLIDLDKRKITNVRKNPYTKKDFSKREKEIKKYKMSYEKDINIDPKEINFFRIIQRAYQNALRKSEVKKDYYLLINITFNEKSIGKYIFNCNKNKYEILPFKKIIKPMSELKIDYRYLFGLLTGLYHWNNAEVGSHILTKRVPDKFNRSAQRFLNFFSCV
ncbi:MBL fold metallo-hydrolase [Candidatus Pelagibacter bacterium]|nr:MBL fold metallo-hydrolase [Candidatus Pelagibacter bacterium]